jgi:hypothetical protein
VQNQVPRKKLAARIWRWNKLRFRVALLYGHWQDRFRLECGAKDKVPERRLGDGAARSPDTPQDDVPDGEQDEQKFPEWEESDEEIGGCPIFEVPGGNCGAFCGSDMNSGQQRTGESENAYQRWRMRRGIAREARWAG